MLQEGRIYVCGVRRSEGFGTGYIVKITRFSNYPKLHDMLEYLQTNW